MTTTEHVLVVGGGMEIPGLLRAHVPGLRTSVMCQMYVLPRLRDVDQHARVLAFQSDSPDTEWIGAALGIHRDDPFTRIAAFSERDQLRAARLAEALGLAWHPVELVRAVYDKELTRRILAEAGVEKVVARRCASGDEAADWVAGNPGRWVLKPVDGTGSAGVSVVSTPEEARHAYARCSKADHSGDIDRAHVLVEEYLTGPQISVESFSEDGEHCVVAATGKFSHPGSLVELGHVVPALISESQREDVWRYLPEVLDALGVRNGTCHTELVLTDAGPRLIETHLRLGGDDIPALVKGATGVDLVDAIVRQTVGERVLAQIRERLEHRPEQAQAIWFGSSPCEGRVVRVEGLEELKSQDGFDVESYVGAEDDVRTLEDSHTRILQVRAHAPTPEEAVRKAYEAVSSCRLVLSVPLVGGTAPDEAV